MCSSACKPLRTHVSERFHLYASVAERALPGATHLSPVACLSRRVGRIYKQMACRGGLSAADAALKGISQSCPIARYFMPQKQTHQIAMTALRNTAPARGGLGPNRIGRLPSLT
jgi:hypothetical protein